MVLHTRPTPLTFAVAAAVLPLAVVSTALKSQAQEQPLTPLRDYLVLTGATQPRRAALTIDVLAHSLATGAWSPPREGDTVTLPDGSQSAWKRATADEEGWLADAGLRSGYAWVGVESPRDRVVLLDATGHGVVYVNGRPRVGDPYSSRPGPIPIALRVGGNGLLFAGARRGRLQARIVNPVARVFLQTRDATLPDLVAGAPVDADGAVVVVNATRRALTDLRIAAALGSAAPVITRLPTVPPLATRKVGFRMTGAPPDGGDDQAAVRLELLRGPKDDPVILHDLRVDLRVRKPGAPRRETFRSEIDGSVQYFALQPARPLTGDSRRPALVLSLHGAAVEAIGHARAYSAKSWAHIVAPTNRRPFGFDWEDQGRLDALEVLELAHRRFGTDRHRTYLTGHSMGGHGTWQLGALFPDRFAAIGPSAGWISFQTYVGTGSTNADDALRRVFSRASATSDTLAAVHNLSRTAVYVLHGDRDDNVPVAQARQMKSALEPFHRDLHYYEQPDAGHWWDDSDEPGAGCVDWAPMFDLFARRALPPRDAVLEVDFTTANPGASASCHWLTVEAQHRVLEPSRVRMRYLPGSRAFHGSSSNVETLSVDVAHLRPNESIGVRIDDTKLDGLEWPHAAERLWFRRTTAEGPWERIERPARRRKGPHRYGPFKDVFRRRVQFVYGTRGTPDEQAWAFAKARFDAATFLYRGNASVDVIADRDFDPGAEPDRNVVLYGNADTNTSWKTLLATSPVVVRRRTVHVGKRQFTSDELGCVFVRPRPGSDTAYVGAVGGSGVAGMRTTDRMRFFVSGIGFPDCLVIRPDVFLNGHRGVLTAGFFDLDWRVREDDFIWGEPGK